MITINKLSFGYHPKKILYRDVTLRLESGKIHGFLGKNGAGKTTLLQNIVGLLFPTSGEIHVDDFQPRKREPAFLQNLYFIPEEIFVPAISMDKYIALYAVFYPKFDETQLKQYLEDFQLPTNQTLSKLSAGQQKKFIIAFGLACNTDILIMDEPTNSLDIPSKSTFRKLIANALTDEKTFVISTHQVRDLDNLIDEVVMIDKGSIVLKTSMADISQKICFKTIPEPTENTLFSERSLRGYDVILKNNHEEESKVNLEQFFNALTAYPERFSSIFNNN